ncbi:MAG TPA: hypothetical protein VJ485_02235 [archaeon]|nr:hypothetical protein [archaeon]
MDKIYLSNGGSFLEMQAYVNGQAAQQKHVDFFLADLGEEKNMSEIYKAARFLIQKKNRL